MDILSFEKLTYQMGQAGRQVVVSGKVPSGGVLRLEGPSGSGKSTLLRVLARLKERQGGELFFKGQSVSEIAPTAWRRHVHYVAQRPVSFTGKVGDNLLLPYSLGVHRGETPPDMEAFKDAMRSVVLDPALLTQDARTLSGGEMARVALLRALFSQPSVLLLDEPTASLDLEARQNTLALLHRWVRQAPDRGLVWVSHTDDIAEIETVNRLTLSGRGEENR